MGILQHTPIHTLTTTPSHTHTWATVVEPFILSRSGKPRLRPILMHGMDTVDITSHMPATMDVHMDITEDTGTDMVDIHMQDTATVITTENKFPFIHQIQYRRKKTEKENITNLLKQQ